MWGHYSYIVSALIFTGIPTVLVVFFFYRLIKAHFRLIAKLTLILLAVTPIVERVALMTDAWKYSNEKSLGIFIFGGYVETLVVTFFITIAVSSMTIVWLHYVDRGKSPGLSTARDCLKGTYSIFSLS